MTTEQFKQRRLQRQQKSDQKNYSALLKTGMNVYIHDHDNQGFIIRLTLNESGNVQRGEPRHGSSHVIQPAVIS